MLEKIKEYSLRKNSWFLFSGICLFLECSALFVQHVLGFNPCLICVQQRSLFLLLMVVAFLASFFRKTKISYLFLLAMIGMVGKILFLAIEKVKLETNNSLISFCAIEKPFPEWLPLDEWLPYVFKNVGSCSDKDVDILGLTLSGHLVIISSLMLLSLVCVLVAKISTKKGKTIEKK